MKKMLMLSALLCNAMEMRAMLPSETWSCEGIFYYETEKFKADNGDQLTEGVALDLRIQYRSESGGVGLKRTG